MNLAIRILRRRAPVPAWPGAILPAVMLVLLIGCDGGSTGPGGGHIQSVFQGTVASLSDGPIAGAKLVLLDPSVYRVAAGPVETDRTGHYRFDPAPVGSFYLVVFTPDHLALDAPRTRVDIAAVGNPPHDVLMFKSEFWGDEPPDVVGTVVDDETGEPVSDAFVSSFFGSVWHTYWGLGTPYECITDSQGRFALVLAQPGIIGVGVSKEGYDLFFAADAGPPVPPDTVTVLDVRLTRGRDSAVIRGRVLFEGAPVAGVSVAADFADLGGVIIPRTSTSVPDDPDRVPALGHSTRTDRDGRFEMDALAEGFYTIEAGYLPDDGYCMGWKQVDLAAGDTLDLDDIVLLPVMEPLSPAQDARITDTTPTFSWTPIDGADRYIFQADTGHIIEHRFEIGGSPEFTWPDSLAFQPGDYIRWEAIAFRGSYSGLDRVGGFDALSVFSIKDR